MAEASITRKLTPAEFNHVVEAVDSEQKRAAAVVSDHNTDARIRAEERQRAAALSLILGKLR